MDYQNNNIHNDHDNYVDLAELPSDVFDMDDLDLDRPRSAADSSSWPAESSPAPAPLEVEDEGMEETDYSEHEASEHEVEGDDDQDLDEDEIEEDSEDQEEEDQEDHETGDEHDDYDAEDAELLEALLEDQAEVEMGEFMDQDHWDNEAELDEAWAEEPSPDSRAQQRTIPNFLAGFHYNDRDRQSEAPSESLFVDQGHDLLPPIESLLSSVRRSHARAVDLLHLQRGQSLRPPAQDRSLLGPSGRGAAGPSRESQRLNHRHHPYGMPQDQNNNLRGRMERENGRVRDELVAVEMRSLRGGMHRNRTPPRSQPEVIDLTGEPDSPDEPSVIVAPRPRAPNALQNPGRNPRRRLSLNQRTPSLARSDSSILGNNQNVIDLTLDDSPVLPPLPQQLPLPRRSNHNHHNHHNHANPNPHFHRPHPHHHRAQFGMSRVPFISLDEQEGPGPSISARLADFVIHRLGFGRGPQDVEVQVIGGGLNMDNPIAGNIPILDYSNNAAAARHVPKRDHVPPPKARDGFTRDTGGEDDVVVCPSCEKELKYDPDAADDTSAMSPARPAKKPRSKKDQEEHHFWALKDCGHVSFTRRQPFFCLS